MNDHQSEIERAIQNDLNPQERALIEHGRDLSRQKVEGVDLDNWITIGLAHNAHIRLALRLANTNKRSGSIYAKHLSDMMRYYGIKGDKRYKGILTALAFILDEEHPERLEALNEARAKMSPGEKATLASPHTARTLIKRLLNEKSGYEPAPKGRTWKQKEKDLLDKVAHLEEQLASSDDSGAVFTPTDTAKEIVAAMSGSVSRNKLMEVQKAIGVWLKDHPVQKPKPPTR
ncbi:hypothetical protein UP09_14250 [Bradyrhizobium sp. LTSP885]|uniref:hypothetical protein n=1 Tax=Bradyrhizobium sp. LTSP885 TaxID=1619232 RepID=UPI0005CAF939|nr:hypothetical protein [Bradyrhizobium sp. LTSP885]KJC44810.1 hypothetical protein UP09_14250 [Bradyrhizobium sp. LTSP885]